MQYVGSNRTAHNDVAYRPEVRFLRQTTPTINIAHA
jgi:hypothetical protein